MPKIIITLEITDPETVDDYRETHQNLILEDIVHGTLGEKCGMVGVEVVE